MMFQEDREALNTVDREEAETMIVEQETQEAECYRRIGELYVKQHAMDYEAAYAGVMAELFAVRSKIALCRDRLETIAKEEAAEQEAAQEVVEEPVVQEPIVEEPVAETVPSDAARVCPTCGHVLDDVMRFCIKCGTKYPEPSEADPPVTAETAASVDATVSVAPPTQQVCRVCGKVLSANAKFCTQCGTSCEAPAETGEIACPRCGKKNAAEMNFCTSCGRELRTSEPAVCPHCGKALPEGARFCVGCGHPVA